MRRTFLALPVFMFACATSAPEQSGTRRAQDAAQQQYQGAAEAQQHATQEQQKAEQAQRDVDQQQKALTEGKARLEGQRAKAAQSQQDAGRLGRDAQQRGGQAQVQATQLQGDEALQSQRAELAGVSSRMDISGAVAEVTSSSLTVRSQLRGEVRLRIAASTTVSLDGRAASPDQIRAGNDVRASYGMIDGQSTAVHLEVTSRAAEQGNGALRN